MLLLMERFYGRENHILTTRLPGELPGILNRAIVAGLGSQRSAISANRILAVGALEQLEGPRKLDRRVPAAQRGVAPIPPRRSKVARGSRQWGPHYRPAHASAAASLGTQGTPHLRPHGQSPTKRRLLCQYSERCRRADRAPRKPASRNEGNRLLLRHGSAAFLSRNKNL